MNLTIASVEAIPLAATWDRVFGSWDKVPPSLLAPASSHRTLPRRGQFTTLVRIRTRDGLEGIGEAYGLPSPEIPAAVVNALFADLLIGRDAMAVEALWDLLYGAQKAAGRTSGFYLEAMSGVDIALWDLRGKALNQPIHRLLGGPIRERIPCYASPVPFYDTPEESAAHAKEFVGKGFSAIKLKLGRGVSTDVAHTAAIRDAIGPDVALLVDLNCAYRVSEAVQVGRELASLGVYWLEEPIEPTEIAGLAEVRDKVGLRIATGESIFTRSGARDLITVGAADVLMPNPTRAGGITELWRIAHLCDTFQVDLSLHGVGSGIGIAAALQVAAASPSFTIYESNQLLNPLRHGLLADATSLQFERGSLTVPTGPGLGIELNEDAVREFAV